MTLVCAWCQVIQSNDHDPLPEEQDVSHTICPQCSVAHFAVCVALPEHHLAASEPQSLHAAR